MHTHFVNAYIVARGDLVAIADHMGISPLEALKLAIDPEIAPLLEHFVKLERTRHLLSGLLHQTEAAETLNELTKIPAERPRASIMLARLSIAMAAAARPPREPGVQRPIRAALGARSDVPKKANAASTLEAGSPNDDTTTHDAPEALEARPLSIKMDTTPTQDRAAERAGAR